MTSLRCDETQGSNRWQPTFITRRHQNCILSAEDAGCVCIPFKRKAYSWGTCNMPFTVIAVIWYVPQLQVIYTLEHHRWRPQEVQYLSQSGFPTFICLACRRDSKIIILTWFLPTLQSTDLYLSVYRYGFLSTVFLFVCFSLRVGWWEVKLDFTTMQFTHSTPENLQGIFYNILLPGCQL